MKRKSAHRLGNVLMGLGLLTMVGGVLYSVLNQLPVINLPAFMAQAAIFGIFIGALLWLVGASVGGREKVSDHYYWLRNCDDRCRRRSASRHPHN